jgi:hypothetical protein
MSLYRPANIFAQKKRSLVMDGGQPTSKYCPAQSGGFQGNTFFNGFLSRHSSPPLFADSFQKNVSAARDHFLLRGFLAFDLAFGGFLSFLLSVSDSLCAIVTAGCAAVPEPSLSGVLRSHLFQAKGNESSGDCTRTGLGLESALKVLR